MGYNETPTLFEENTMFKNVHPHAKTVAKIVTVKLVLPIAITTAALVIVNKIDKKISPAAE